MIIYFILSFSICVFAETHQPEQGQKVNQNEFPFLASVAIANYRTPTHFTFLCESALISSEWLLASVSCYKHNAILRAFVGNYDPSDPLNSQIQRKFWKIVEQVWTRSIGLFRLEVGLNLKVLNIAPAALVKGRPQGMVTMIAWKMDNTTNGESFSLYRYDSSILDRGVCKEKVKDACEYDYLVFQTFCIDDIKGKDDLFFEVNVWGPVITNGNQVVSFVDRHSHKEVTPGCPSFHDYIDLDFDVINQYVSDVEWIM